MEVGVADFLLIGALAGESLRAAAAGCPPAATIADLPDLPHVHVDHVAGVAGCDRPWPAEVLAARGDASDPVQAEPVRPARHGPHTAPDAVPVGELTSNPSSGPLLLSSPVFDQLHHPHGQPRWTVCWCA